MPERTGFVHKWGTGPLIVYLCGILLPVCVAAMREELMIVLGVPVYTVSFWTGPFASAAAVVWTNWSAAWCAAWVLLVPVSIAALLGAVVTFIT